MDVEFKEPQTIPQDLLLIQDIVATTHRVAHRPPEADEHSSDDDSIASSHNESDSEVEVAANLMPCREENVQQSAFTNGHPDSSSDSDSESSSGEDSDVEVAQKEALVSTSHGYASDAECDELAAPGDIGYAHSKNEVVEADIVVPDISQVDPNDVLEKLGEVTSIVGNVVIVKGLPADNVKTLAERALDAETLLVFEDRQVLGYIYETFGPTSQPLYQIKFNQKYPLDIEKVRISREIFHVPQKSKYVFVDQLKRLRGSDASNIHDEEPAEDELEFSDDEKEAAFKQQRKKRRQQSVASSRQTTPAPSEQMSDHIFYGSNPYDAHGPYDDDYRVSGPSRQPPLPYDDPYAEPTHEMMDQEPDDFASGRLQSSAEGRHFEARGRGRGHRGRGHGREGRGHRGRMQRSRPGRSRGSTASREPSDLNYYPPSLAPGTPEDAAVEHFASNAPMYSSTPWSYQQPGSLQSPNYQLPVQPHINPRFASAFGITLPANIGQWSSQQGQQAAPYYMAQGQQNWGAPWPQPGDDSVDGDTYSPM